MRMVKKDSMWLLISGWGVLIDDENSKEIENSRRSEFHELSFGHNAFEIL